MHPVSLAVLMKLISLYSFLVSSWNFIFWNPSLRFLVFLVLFSVCGNCCNFIALVRHLFLFLPSFFFNIISLRINLSFNPVFVFYSILSLYSTISLVSFIPLALDPNFPFQPPRARLICRARILPVLLWFACVPVCHYTAVICAATHTKRRTRIRRYPRRTAGDSVRVQYVLSLPHGWLLVFDSWIILCTRGVVNRRLNILADQSARRQRETDIRDFTNRSLA